MRLAHSYFRDPLTAATGGVGRRQTLGRFNNTPSMSFKKCRNTDCDQWFTNDGKSKICDICKAKVGERRQKDMNAFNIKKPKPPNKKSLFPREHAPGERFEDGEKPL